MTTRDRDLLGGLGRGLGGLLGDGALARLLALRLLGGRLDDLRRRGLALDGGLGLLGGDDRLGGGRRGVGVLGEGGGRHGLPAAARVQGASLAWTGRIDLRAGGIRRAAAGRRFVACAGNEVKKQRSGALRLRRRVCAARALRRGGGPRAAQILAAADLAPSARAPFHAAPRAWGLFVCVRAARPRALRAAEYLCACTRARTRGAGERLEGRSSKVELIGQC